MTTNTVIIFVVIAIAAIALGLYVVRSLKIRSMRSRYGPEYDRALQQAGSRHKAMADLREREKRVRSFELKALSSEDVARFEGDWTSIQAKFVEDPLQADAEADALIEEILQARGYPQADFKQRTADLSVDHANVIPRYRTAHELATRQDGADVDTEELRQAMLHFRALYDELMASAANDATPARPRLGRAS